MVPAERLQEHQQLQVEVVYSPEPGCVELRQVQLKPGALLTDALAASGFLQAYAAPVAGWRVGIWGRVQDLQTPLREHDRVELYRALLVDPKEARRLRYKKHRPAKTDKAAKSLVAAEGLG